MTNISASQYGKLLTVALFWGATWVAGRIAVGEVSPLAVASWRFLLAATVLGTLLVKKEGWPRWSRQDLIGIFGLGASGIFLYNLCFLYGLQHIEAGRGALVVALTPVAIAAADVIFFGAAMTPRRSAGIGIALVGCLLVVTRGNLQVLSGGVGLGELLILGCVVLWTAYTFIGRSVGKRLSPLSATFGASLAGWSMLTVAALFDGSLFALSNLTTGGALSIAFLGILGTAVAFTWYAEAVGQLGAMRTGMFINLVPLFAVLLGAAILHERLTAATLFGGALIVAGVVTLNWSPRKIEVSSSVGADRAPSLNVGANTK
ncbi:MAG: DMT family transporter [Rhodocyclaceae bacterium]|nr:DMT family transporter [Rhodocyclaceae bacterium]